jgi:hypothetical protein
VGACAAPSVTSIRKKGAGTADAQQMLGGGGDTKVRQQKARREMQHPI